MQDNNQENVWISREEYERLKNAAPPQQPVVDRDVSPSSTGINRKEWVLVALALIAFVFPPMFIVVLLLGIHTMVTSVKKLQKPQRPTKGRVALIILVILLAIPLVPVLLFIAFFVIWQVNCWIDPSACRSA